MAKYLVQWVGEAPQSRVAIREAKPGSLDRLWRAKITQAASQYPGEPWLASAYDARIRDAEGVARLVRISPSGRYRWPGTSLSFTIRGLVTHVLRESTE